VLKNTRKWFLNHKGVFYIFFLINLQVNTIFFRMIFFMSSFTWNASITQLKEAASFFRILVDLSRPIKGTNLSGRVDKLRTYSKCILQHSWGWLLLHYTTLKTPNHLNKGFVRVCNCVYGANDITWPGLCNAMIWPLFKMCFKARRSSMGDLLIPDPRLPHCFTFHNKSPRSREKLAVT